MRSREELLEAPPPVRSWRIRGGAGVTRWDLPRKSVALTIIGAAMVMLGAGLAYRPEYPGDVPPLFQATPVQVTASAWIVLGGFTVIFAWSSRCQWVAAITAVIMPMVRVLSYGLIGVHALIPGGPSGSIAAFGYSFAWLGVTATITLIAGWVEYDRPEVEIRKHDRARKKN